MLTEAHSGTAAQILCINSETEVMSKELQWNFLVCSRDKKKHQQTLKNAIKASSVELIHLISCSASRNPGRLSEVTMQPRSLRVKSVLIHDI